MTSQSGYFYGQHDQRLFYQSWKTKNPKGIFVITHGLSENSDRYNNIALYLNQYGWNVYGWDLRGHGRSMGIRGYVRNFRLFERDLVRFLHFISSKEQSLPIVLFGHSLGALIICRSLMHEEDLVTSAHGICLTAPALGLRWTMPFIKLVTSYIIHLVFPWMTFYNKILSSYLSRDPYFRTIIENDIFRHNKISPEIYLSIFKNPRIMKSSVHAQCRFLIQAPGKDFIINNNIVHEYFQKIKTPNPKKLIYYPENLHQVLEDYGRDIVLEDMKNFIQPIIHQS